MPIGFETVTARDFDVLEKALPSKKIPGKKSSLQNYFPGFYGEAKQANVIEPMLVSPINYTLMYSMYKNNVWIRSIIDKIVKRVVAIPHKVKPVAPKLPGKNIPKKIRNQIEEVEEFFINPNERTESFTQIRKKVATDVLLYDAGVFEVIPGVSFINGIKKVPVRLYSVPGDTIKKRVDKKGNFLDFNKAYVQMVGSKVENVFAVNEIMYLMQYPKAGSVYGTSPLETLYHTVTAELYAADYNKEFFANNATPRYAVLFKNMGFGEEPGTDKLKRYLEYWDSELRGNPHRPILLGSEEGDIEFKTVNLSNEEMQFQEYSHWLLIKMMSVYGMQPLVMGLVDKTTGKLNSEQQGEQFKQDAIIPMLEIFSTAINELLIWDETDGFGYKDIYLDWHGIDKTDDKKDAEILEIYARMGSITVNEVRERVGWPPVPWGNTAYVNQALIPIGTNPQIANPKPTEQITDGKSNVNPGTGLSLDKEMEIIREILVERNKHKLITYGS